MAPMAFLIWEPTHCYPIWQRGGGIYISGGNVAIETSQIFSNTAIYVRYAQFQTTTVTEQSIAPLM